MREVVKGQKGDKDVGSALVASQFRKRTVVNVPPASKYHLFYVSANAL